jgi:hypothetical protein
MSQTAAARNLAKTARYILESLRNNGACPTRYYDTPEGLAAMERLVQTGRARFVMRGKEGQVIFTAGTGETYIEAIATVAGEQTSTTTDKAPVVTMETPVSVTIGSDQYAATVVRVTASTVVVKHGRRGEMTFRPYVSKSKQYDAQAKTWVPYRGWRANENYYLVIGESKTELDPSF